MNEFVESRLKAIIHLCARIESENDKAREKAIFNIEISNIGSFIIEIKDIAEDLINYIENEHGCENCNDECSCNCHAKDDFNKEPSN